MGGNDDVIFPTEYLSREHFEKKRGLKAWCFWLVGNSGSGKSTKLSILVSFQNVPLTNTQSEKLRRRYHPYQ
jgi:ABC-type lipoprotein export system ATPase subunit